MAATPPSSSGVSASSHKRVSPSLIANATKRKGAFFQLFVMTGIFMLSCRSLGQKYRIRDLSEDNAELRQERDALANRMDYLKTELRREAALDGSGALASHLRRLFGES